MDRIDGFKEYLQLYPKTDPLQSDLDWRSDMFEEYSRYSLGVGTITWYESAKGELPLISDEKISKQHEESDTVLICIKNNREEWLSAKGRYSHKSKTWSNDRGNWQPTHWSYINYPF